MNRNIKLIANEGTISEINLDLNRDQVLLNKDNVLMLDGREQYRGVYLIFKNPDGSATYDAVFYPSETPAWSGYRQYVRTGSPYKHEPLTYKFSLSPSKKIIIVHGRKLNTDGAIVDNGINWIYFWFDTKSDALAWYKREFHEDYPEHMVINPVTRDLPGKYDKFGIGLHK